MVSIQPGGEETFFLYQYPVINTHSSNSPKIGIVSLVSVSAYLFCSLSLPSLLLLFSPLRPLLLFPTEAPEGSPTSHATPSFSPLLYPYSESSWHSLSLSFINSYCLFFSFFSFSPSFLLSSLSPSSSLFLSPLSPPQNLRIIAVANLTELGITWPPTKLTTGSTESFILSLLIILVPIIL